MSVLDLMGQPVDKLHYERYGDIPSDINKAYMFPFDEDGGIGAKVGRYFDPVPVAHEETLTMDKLPTGLKNWKPYIVPLVGLGILFFIMRLK
jgi:hypothetical protein